MRERWKQLETSDREVCIKKMEKGSDFNKLNSLRTCFIWGMHAQLQSRVWLFATL